MNSPPSRKKTILVCHQAAELYGSDRSLLDLLIGIDSHQFNLIVLLPENGPLYDELQKHKIEVHVAPLVKIGRAMFSLSGMLKLPAQFYTALKSINKAVGAREVDVVYTNTLAILAGALWAAINRKPHVWHVREIIQRPKIVAAGLRLTAVLFSRLIICNSQSTKKWIDQVHYSAKSKSIVVWNGVARSSSPSSEEEKRALRDDLGVPADCLLMSIVGRINSWKGQDLVLDALEKLPAQSQEKIHVLIVGGPPPGQEEHLQKLKKRVKDSSQGHRIHIKGFTSEVDKYFRGSDVLIVPSREPEPFGRVAIEAMAHGVPVIAANHGGLQEIVKDPDTGLLFAPNNANELAACMEKMLDSSYRSSAAVYSYRRQGEIFSVDAYRKAAISAIEAEIVK